MKFLQYFFRAKEDYISITFLSPLHILAILILFGLIIYTANFRKKTKEERDKFLRFLGWAMIITQIIIYIWFFASGTFTMQVSLPMYACRMVIWFFVYVIFKGSNNLKKVSIYWGLMGSILAISVPDMYAYKFPHITNFHFFIFHYYLMMASIYYIVVEKIKLNKNDLLYVLKFTLIYNIGLLIFNLLLSIPFPGANYGFLVQPPAVIASIIPFNGVVYMLFAQLMYLLSICLMHGVYLFIRKIFLK